MKNPAKKPALPKRLFWDVNPDNLDFDKKAAFVIERVFEWGDVDDIRSIRRYYGDSKVSDVLLEAKYLALKTIYLASAITGRTLTDFRCYRNRQLNPGRSVY
jgi:hypothetical protein